MAAGFWLKNAIFACARAVQFFFTFIFKPTSVGAIAPSSERLAEEMVADLPWEEIKVVVEYGPGTGAFSRFVVERLPEGATYFAVERSPAMIKAFRKRYPHLRVYGDSVENIQTICETEGVDQIDLVISGLPWANFPTELQKKLMDATVGVMRPGSYFVTFTYVHSRWVFSGMKRLQSLLTSYFPQVELSEIVWANLPPARVFRCRL